MLDPVIIIPENGNSPLLQQLNNIDVHDAMKSVIKGFQPQRITILPSSGNITIDCQIEPPPEPILCSQLGDLLKQVIPGATRVDLVLAPPVVTVPLSVEELLMDKLEDIQDFICCRIPSASGWLDLASLKIENDKIILEVMDEMAHKNMKERNVEAVLADFFRSHGHNLPISLQKRDGEVSREMMDQMYGAPSPVVLPQSANNSDSSSSSLPQSQGGK
jgi:hypothetical protein